MAGTSGLVVNSGLQEEEKRTGGADLPKKPLDELNPRLEKPVPGSTLRCLEDPLFTDSVPVKIVSGSNSSTEIEARNRFDHFWGGKEGETVTAATTTTNGEDQKGPNWMKCSSGIVARFSLNE